MLTKSNDITRYEEHLASYAMHSKDSEGRDVFEPEHEYRTMYQRDRDRIVHCEAFRNLEYKTQVFVIFEGDYYRTRLTHTIEVAQIARTIGRNLGLNEDLIEAIALAHDVGHAPFGHAGEEVLQDIMKDYGGFNHNLHGYRIVTEIEKRYPDFRGLNLTYEVKEGIVKHTTAFDLPSQVSEFKRGEQPTLEAQVVEIADEIAYYNHDLDDGLTARLITENDLPKVALWREPYQEIRKKHPQYDTNMLKYHLIRELIDKQVRDLLKESDRRIRLLKIDSVDDVRRQKQRVISFSANMQKHRREAICFLNENLYHHTRVERMTCKARRFIRRLFEAYLENERQLPPEEFRRTQGKTKKEKYLVICDYIAAMTDRFVLDEYKKLFDPDEKV